MTGTNGCVHACPWQAALLAAQVVWVYWYCLALYWSPSQGSGTARAHLRAFAALKSLSFVFSALQLRSGYPPPASYQCAGAAAATTTSPPAPSPYSMCHASKPKKGLPGKCGSKFRCYPSASSGALWGDSSMPAGLSSSPGPLHTLISHCDHAWNVHVCDGYGRQFHAGTCLRVWHNTIICVCSNKERLHATDVITE